MHATKDRKRWRLGDKILDREAEMGKDRLRKT